MDTFLSAVETVAVLVGLLFVAKQIRLQVKEAQISNYLEVMQARTAITEREIETPALLGIYTRNAFPVVSSLDDWNKLDVEDKRLYLHLGTLVSAQERAYTLFLSRNLTRDDFEAEMAAMRELMVLPILRNTWPYLKTFYRRDFVEYVARDAHLRPSTVNHAV